MVIKLNEEKKIAEIRKIKKIEQTNKRLLEKFDQIHQERLFLEGKSSKNNDKKQIFTSPNGSLAQKKIELAKMNEFLKKSLEAESEKKEKNKEKMNKFLIKSGKMKFQTSKPLKLL